MECSDISLCNDCEVPGCMSKGQFYEVIECGKRREFDAKQVGE